MKCKYEGSGWAEGRCMGSKEIDPCPGYDKCKRFKPNYKTNADRIRSMTDEELAVALKIIAKYDVCFNTQCEKCGDCIFYPFCNSVRCAEDVAEWLKQPYKEDAQ